VPTGMPRAWTVVSWESPCCQRVMKRASSVGVIESLSCAGAAIDSEAIRRSAPGHARFEGESQRAITRSSRCTRSRIGTPAQAQPLALKPFADEP
jgi:hypothetical protein